MTIEESGRTVPAARAIALAERTFANREKTHRWLYKRLASLDDRLDPNDNRKTARRRNPGKDCLGRGYLMRLWRLSNAEDAVNALDGLEKALFHYGDSAALNPQLK